MEINNSIQQLPLQARFSPDFNKEGTARPGNEKANRPGGNTTDSVSISDKAREKNAQELSGARSTQGSEGASGETLTQEELTQLSELKARDVEVRAHEQAHLAAAGGHATGGPSFTLQKGPDGKSYAVGGEVGIDLSKENDPNATIQKMQTIKRAALAPANPSSTDRQVAAQASVKQSQARQELLKEQQEILLATKKSEHNPQAPPHKDSVESAEGVSVQSLTASLSIYEQISAL